MLFAGVEELSAVAVSVVLDVSVQQIEQVPFESVGELIFPEMSSSILHEVVWPVCMLNAMLEPVLLGDLQSFL